MADSKTTDLRIVIASPSDVQKEREAALRVIDDYNRHRWVPRLTLTPFSWDTDAYPAFHLQGPQGIIDSLADITQSGILVVIFWSRFGSPIAPGALETGTQHEFRIAYESWKEKGSPQIMVYFKRKAVAIDKSEDAAQWGAVLQFKETFPDEGMYKEYKGGTAEFERVFRNDLLETTRKIDQKMHDFDGTDLPSGYPFDYEKTIIDEYSKPRDEARRKKLAELGCPEEWPGVEKETATKPNPPELQGKIGSYRSEEAAILVDTRTEYRVGRAGLKTGPTISNLAFPEAGPRANFCYPRSNALNVGIVVSGGIAPGINAVIDGIVSRHWLYSQKQYEMGLAVNGYIEGFRGLLRGRQNKMDLVSEGKIAVEIKAERGGSMLGTSRADDLLSPDKEKSVAALKSLVLSLDHDKVEILYVIGGDGSMKAAHAIWTMARKMNKGISVVGIPKTTDNDILWVWQSFGFLSAVDKAREAILNLHTEVTSNPRLCILQLFGSDSGFVVSHAALASGACDAALIPEVPFRMKVKNPTSERKGLSQYICEKLKDRLLQRKPYGLIVMAETAIPKDAEEYLNGPVDLSDFERKAVIKFLKEKRIAGQTPDYLRAAGVKIVSGVLQAEIKALHLGGESYWEDFRVFTNEPRHLIRSIRPSVGDVVSGKRLGALAVDNAMAGYTDFMVSQWLTEYVLVPLRLVVLGRKRVPPDGVFWKSVVASTGQPLKMCEEKDDEDERARNPRG